MSALLSASPRPTTTYATRSTTALFDRVAQLIALGKTGLALEGLADALNTLRDDMPPADWLAYTREAASDPLAAVLHQDPFTRRAFEKPRGYAGDAPMMDLIYGLYDYDCASRSATAVGHAVMEWIRHRPACTSVRLRRNHIAQLIDGLAAGSRPDILAIAAGHFREAEASLAILEGNVGRVVAFDADGDSVAEIASRYGVLGVEAVKGSVREILAGKAKLGTFDFVYAAGLFDYLTESVATALTQQMFDMLTPGGRLLIPNFTPDCADTGYMEAFMAWKLVYRHEFDMAKLVAALPAERVAGYDLYRDRTGSIVYLTVQKTEWFINTGKQ